MTADVASATAASASTLAVRCHLAPRRTDDLLPEDGLCSVREGNAAARQETSNGDDGIGGIPSNCTDGVVGIPTAQAITCAQCPE